MGYTPHGKQLIAGEQITGDAMFQSQPANGEAHSFSVGTPAMIDKACIAAEEAFASYSQTSTEERAVFLETIADEIDARAEAITEIGSSETGLPEARLQGERGRTTGQLKLFANHIREGSHLDRRFDKALPDRQPIPRPDLKLVQRPIGPVAVFGASNFPLAFSTAGGDTASALAAGCPVVVKGHSAHPGTAEIVGDAIAAAVTKCKLHPGVFSLVQGGKRDVGQSLVQHPLINAVGFTGSLGGGRALFDLCVQRETPIPFFGELGSVNPMFLLPQATQNRGEEIGKGWSGSLTMGAGQFCTNPGVALVIEGEHADAFIKSASEGLAGIDKQTMLTDGIADAYRDGAKRIASTTGVSEIIGTSCQTRDAAPYLFKTTGDAWLNNEELGEEVFGPLGVVVVVKDIEQMTEIAKQLKGQLTCTIHMDEGDTDSANTLVPVIERKAGRLLVNGFPTGVEVSDTMVHGGPYPASTNFGATSVGTMAIRRFLRPVCYQNFPDAILPTDLK